MINGWIQFVVNLKYQVKVYVDLNLNLELVEFVQNKHFSGDIKNSTKLTFSGKVWKYLI